MCARMDIECKDISAKRGRTADELKTKGSTRPRHTALLSSIQPILFVYLDYIIGIGRCFHIVSILKSHSFNHLTEKENKTNKCSQ